jgi:hypothetical protein
MNHCTHVNSGTPSENAQRRFVLLLGEGKDELNFFTALVKHLGLTAFIKVEQYAGKPKLAAFLSALPARTDFPNLRTIGITCDADEDYESTLKSVQSSIQKANFPEHIQIKTHILPGKDKCGALEALVLKFVEESSPVWDCVERFTECVEPKDKSPLSLTETDKRRIHAWLSTLPKPDLRLGEAALKSLIPFDHSAFKPITDFLKSLVPVTDNQGSLEHA